MAGKLGNLLITIAGDVEQLRADMSKGVAIVDNATARMAKAAASAKAALAGVGVGLSVAGLVNFAKHGIDAADAMNNLATRAGVTTEEFSKLAYAARQADIGDSELVQGLAIFSTNLQKARNGVKSAQDALRDLGVTDFSNFNKALGQAADKVQSLGRSSKSIALLRGAFGRGGGSLAVLFEDGAQGLSEFADAAERSGNVISNQAGKAADQFNDSMTALQQSVEGVQIAIGVGMLDSLNKIVDAFKRGYEQGGLFDATIDGLRQSFTEAFGDPTQNEIDATTEELKRYEKQLADLQGKSTLGKINQAFMEVFGNEGALQKQIDAAAAKVESLKQKLKGLQDLKADNAKADAGNTTTTNTVVVDPEVDKNAARRAQAEAERLAKQQAAAIKSTVDALQFEIDQFGRAKDAQSQYIELQKAGVTAASEAGQKIIELTKARDALRGIEAGEAAAMQAATAMAEGYNKAKAEGLELTKSLRTPQEALNASIEEYRKQLALGTIDIETYARAVAKGVTDMRTAIDKQDGATDAAKRLNEIGKQLGLTFTSAFEDAALEAKSFGDVASGVLKDIARLILRIGITQPAGDALSGFIGDIFKPGSGKGGIGGGITDWFKGLLGFANGGSFTVGGAGGIDSQLVAFRATPGESVQVGGGGMGGGVVVKFEITANDTRDFDQLLVKRKSLITGMVQQAFEKNAKRGMR